VVETGYAELMALAPRERMTESDYLALERSSLEKHEYVNGERFGMAGGTPLHAAICANVARALGNALRGKGCGVASSDLRVHVPQTHLYTYPDVTVVCGRIETLATDDTVIVNPALIVEVLSESTEAYDRGAKFAHYERLPSLSGYLLVASDGRRLEHFQRVPGDRWLRSVLDAREQPSGSLALEPLGIAVAIADVVEGLDIFAPAS
jgi:Uma2 family endonuclease